MSSWDERFRQGNYPQDPDPDAVLVRYLETIPDGRALDIATGTGRNAVYLAEQGYEVDAIDRSREGLKIARQNADTRDVGDRCSWIHADAHSFEYPVETYDIVTARSFRIMDRLTDIKGAIRPGGYLYYQDHMRTAEGVDYGPPPERRVGANDLLRACLDLTVLHYREFRTGQDGHRGAYAQIIARKSTGHTQPHPHRDQIRARE